MIEGGVADLIVVSFSEGTAKRSHPQIVLSGYVTKEGEKPLSTKEMFVLFVVGNPTLNLLGGGAKGLSVHVC